MAKSVFLEKCAQRWQLESQAVDLYEQAIKACPPELKSRFEEMRNEEKDHQDLLEEVIRNSGQDPRALLTTAQPIKIETQPGFPSLLEAILTAELVDNSHWELLIEMAEELRDLDAIALFEDALDAEDEHLEYVRELVIQMTLSRLQQSDEQAA